MSALSRGVFGGVAAIATAIASPAWANNDAANANVPTVTNASISIQTDEPTGMELCLQWRETAKPYFPISCAMNVDENVVQDVVEDASRNRFLIAAWGGRDEHRKEILNVARRMYMAGDDISVVFGPDKDTHLRASTAELSMEIETYAHGKMAWEKTEEIGTNNLHQISGVVEDRINQAYDANYPVRLASNGSLTTQTPR